MIIFLFWIGFAVIVGIAASHRGRSGLGWGLLAILISPLLAGLLVLVLPRRDALSTIATLAMIEATPEGSRSRQLFAEQLARQQEKGSASWLVGSSSNRPWSASSNRPHSGFIVFVVIWCAVLLVFGFSLFLH
jgi:hypothetical protein